MNQVVQTIHTYQTSDGPALEARVSDPTLGDVRLVVTGRAGEIVQAQLVVRDRVTADAISAAATRMQASGDALTGVSVSVRSDGGGSATGGRAGGDPFEAGSGTRDGYAGGSGPSNNGGHGQSAGNQGSGMAGSETGHPSRGGGSPESAKPIPMSRPETARPNRQLPRTSLPGGSSLDVRA
jgi:hypothetical protein